MTRIAVLIYSLAAYVFSLCAILYLVTFMAGFRLPRQPIEFSPVLVNGGLLLLFGLQHSIMAREGFKRRLAQIIPQEAERSTYVLAASAMTALMLWLWQPMPRVVWHVEPDPARFIIGVVFWFGVGLAVASTFAISHFDFLGVRQGLRFWRRRSTRMPAFQTPLLYQWVRHPMMTGLLIAFWVIPEMTLGRMLFAAGMSIYIMIGTRFEERSLEHNLGPAYAVYKLRTPAFFPAKWKRSQPTSES